MSVADKHNDAKLLAAQYVELLNDDNKSVQVTNAAFELLKDAHEDFIRSVAPEAVAI